MGEPPGDAQDPTEGGTLPLFVIAALDFVSLSNFHLSFSQDVFKAYLSTPPGVPWPYFLALHLS